MQGSFVKHSPEGDDCPWSLSGTRQRARHAALSADLILRTRPGLFFDPDRVIQQDTRCPYGEGRYQLAGQIDGRLFVVVYTPGKGVVRIISARQANSREVKRHENHTSHD
ncbi:MAG: BrnT family toxin [Ottowia sp.]